MNYHNNMSQWSINKHINTVRENNKTRIRLPRPNRKQQREKARARNQKWAKEYLEKNPCIQCGESDILLLDFDHIRDKKYHVSKIICDGMSLKTLKNELKKVQILCVRCHRIKTHGKSWWRLD